MADGRRYNRGVKGRAGRKSKADEIKVIEQMDAALAPSDAWEALANRVTKGDVQAIKVWLAYRFGQPKQDINLNTNDGIISIVMPKDKK